MVDLLAVAQDETNVAVSEEPITRLLRHMYPGANISWQSSKSGQVEVEGRAPVSISDLSDDL